MNEKLKNERTERLFKAIMSLETVEEYYTFFDDLCTAAEITEMSKRLEAAEMLNDSRIYADICEATGLSTATISRVNRCLKYGSDGYTLVLKRLKEKQ